MESSRLESLTLVAALIGAAVLGVGSHTVGAAVGDLAILLAIFGFDTSSVRSGFGSLGFAGVCGFCVLSPLFFLATTVLGAATPSESTPWSFLGAWAVATLILFAVDRFRMSARENVSLASAGLAGAAPVPIVTSTPVSTYRPAPIRVETPAQAVYNPPVYQQPTYAPPPTPVVQAPDFSATNLSAPVAAAIAVPPVADVMAIPPGREALIYLNLVGEGMNVLRTVRAENLGHDYYRIADIMPAGEQWEFTPGQVVKCKKKALSNGKHMVAYEEAPRAQ